MRMRKDDSNINMFISVFLKYKICTVPTIIIAYVNLKQDLTRNVRYD
jgi:hypothetical protein